MKEIIKHIDGIGGRVVTVTGLTDTAMTRDNVLGILNGTQNEVLYVPMFYGDLNGVTYSDGTLTITLADTVPDIHKGDKLFVKLYSDVEIATEEDITDISDKIETSKQEIMGGLIDTGEQYIPSVTAVDSTQGKSVQSIVIEENGNKLLYPLDIGMMDVIHNSEPKEGIVYRHSTQNTTIELTQLLCTDISSEVSIHTEGGSLFITGATFIEAELGKLYRCTGSQTVTFGDNDEYEAVIYLYTEVDTSGYSITDVMTKLQSVQGTNPDATNTAILNAVEKQQLTVTAELVGSEVLFHYVTLNQMEKIHIYTNAGVVGFYITQEDEDFQLCFSQDSPQELAGEMVYEDSLAIKDDVFETIRVPLVGYEIVSVRMDGIDANMLESDINWRLADIQQKSSDLAKEATLGTSSDTSVSTTIFGWLKSIRDFLVGIVTTNPYAKETTAQQAASDAAAAKTAAQAITGYATETNATANKNAIIAEIQANAGVPILTVPDSTASQELAPNTLYVFATRTSTLTLSLGTPIVGIANEYHFFVVCGSTAPTINFPSGISWNGGSAPTIAADKTYEVSILNNVAAYFEV